MRRPFQFGLSGMFAATAAFASLLVPFVYLPFSAAIALIGCVAVGIRVLRRPARFLIAVSLLALVVSVSTLVADSSHARASGSVLLSSVVLAAAGHQMIKKRTDQQEADFGLG